MNKYDSRNKDKRFDRNKHHILRANDELIKMINSASKEVVINVIQDVPDIKKLDYVVLFKLKEPLTPLEFQTLLYQKMRDLI